MEFFAPPKNQPRPKGITTQRLAVIQPIFLELDQVWLKVIGPDDTDQYSATDFYESQAPESVISRTEFWSAVRKCIR